MNTKQKIIFRTKAVRQWKSLSQKDLAAKAGVSQSTIAQIETGRLSPSIDTLDEISQALGVKISAFFAEDDEFLRILGTL